VPSDGGAEGCRILLGVENFKVRIQEHMVGKLKTCQLLLEMSEMKYVNWRVMMLEIERVVRLD